MKFLHLSDLHLGKRVNEFSMLEEQDAILKQILGIIDNELPDGVLIAGDIYDKSVPSAEAFSCLTNFFASLRSVICRSLLSAEITIRPNELPSARALWMPAESIFLPFTTVL